MPTDNEVRGLKSRVIDLLRGYRVSHILIEDVTKEFDNLVGAEAPPRMTTGGERYFLSKINRAPSIHSLNLATLWIIPLPIDESSIYRWLTVSRGQNVTGYLIRSPRGVLMKDIRDEIDKCGFEWFSNYSRLGQVIHQNHLNAYKYVNGVQIFNPVILVRGEMSDNGVIFSESYGLYTPKPITFG